jgi:hypothetical protein
VRKAFVGRTHVLPRCRIPAFGVCRGQQINIVKPSVLTHLARMLGAGGLHSTEGNQPPFPGVLAVRKESAVAEYLEVCLGRGWLEKGACIQSDGWAELQFVAPPARSWGAARVATFTRGSGTAASRRDGRRHRAVNHRAVDTRGQRSNWMSWGEQQTWLKFKN